MKTNSILLQSAARFTFYLLIILSFYMYWRGHNEPGGGFVAGLLASAAIVLQVLAFGISYARQLLPINYLLVTAIGLAIAFVTGFGAMFLQYPFLTSTLWSWNLPVIGLFEFPTAALFDLGVYLTVVGATTSIIFAIGED